MRKVILMLCTALFFTNISAQQLSFSDSTTISLLTCSPGQEAYSKFGHTAIRIIDKVKGTDIVLNYGIFSFDTENFYFKFIKGETDYQLGAYPTDYFLPEYADRNSIVWEQVLNLTPLEKKQLLQLIEKNYLPQNRTYRYNFIFDNCATRPRNLIVKSLDGHLKYTHQTVQKTFRQWIGTYVGFDTWLKFGIDVIFGLGADKIVSLNESMFLPEELMIHLQSAEVINKQNESRHLVSKYNIIVNKNADKTQKSASTIRPITISLGLLIIGILITLWDIKRKRYSKGFDTIILIITGLAGVIVLYLMTFSMHPLVKSNLNILWLNPLNLLVAGVIWIRKLRAYLYVYQALNIVLLVSTLVAFSMSIQVFNLASFPIIVLLLMRTTTWFAYTKKKLFKNREFANS